MYILIYKMLSRVLKQPNTLYNNCCGYCLFGTFVQMHLSINLSQIYYLHEQNISLTYEIYQIKFARVNGALFTVSPDLFSLV